MLSWFFKMTNKKEWKKLLKTINKKELMEYNYNKKKLWCITYKVMYLYINKIYNLKLFYN